MSSAAATPSTGGTHVRAEDEWLAASVALATENVTAGGGPFGAFIVENGVEIGRGVNRVTLDNDPTAHAEVCAIRAACRNKEDFVLRGCTLYTSCEPCPLCLSAALWARVDRVVYAADRHDAARGGFDDLAFWSLFGTPGSQWPMPVGAGEVTGATSPFEAWLRHGDRTAY